MSSVRANQWHLLDVADIGALDPTLSVSVVIPTRDPGERLGRLLLSLAKQTYPSELLDIVVVDDGSEPALELSADAGGVAVQVVRREDDGRFGAGAARNAGAAAATGDVIVFLDSDLLVGPEAIETLVRWNHAAPHAMVTGVLGFFDDEPLGDDTLRSAISDGSIASLLEPHLSDDQVWREKTFTRTFDLTEDAADLFRIVVGAVMVISRDLHISLEGLRELGLRGIEDTEYGYRAHNAGALLVLDRSAPLWHQGRRHFDSGKAATTRKEREPLMVDLLPVAGFRTTCASPPTVPTVVVDLTGNVAADDTAAAVLAASDSTVACVVEHAGADAVDRRVVDATTLTARDRAAAAFQATIADGVRIRNGAFDEACSRMREDGIGVLHLLDDVGTEIGWIATSRALGRARLLGAHDDDLLRIAGEAFGEWWLPGDELGFTTAG